jgi:hypothetical protein
MTGLSLPSTPTTKVMMYADDTNLFASANEDIPNILRVLDSSSLAIGSLFNQNKTLIKPVCYGLGLYTRVDSNALTRLFGIELIMP